MFFFSFDGGNDVVHTFVKYVGIYFVAYKMYELLLFVYENFLRPSCTKNLKKEYGNWAIVTGCTSGIGKAYSYELARKGLNIVLLSRSQEKLEKMAQDMEASTKVNTRYLQVDFSNFTKEKQQEVLDLIKDLDVGLLINNVGLAYDIPEFLVNIDVTKIEKNN